MFSHVFKMVGMIVQVLSIFSLIILGCSYVVDIPIDLLKTILEPVLNCIVTLVIVVSIIFAYKERKNIFK